MSQLLCDLLSSSDSYNKTSNLILLGPKLSGKTNMVWQFAREYAEYKGCGVLIIGFESKLRNIFPLPMRHEDERAAFWSMDVLEKIQLKSINSSRELKEVLAAIHCFRNRPKLIIVEDLSDLLDPFCTSRKNDQKFLESALEIVGHLNDAARVISATLILTESCHDQVYLSLLTRVSPLVLLLKTSGVEAPCDVTLIDRETNSSTLLCHTKVVGEQVILF